MNIDIYKKYNVKIKQEYSTLIDRKFDIFQIDKINEEQIFNGKKLLEEIGNSITDYYISEVDIKDNIVRIETFDFNNGESSTTIYIIEEIKEEI